MSGIGQFDASYNRHEDRILLRITNLEGDEFRFWLTRRLCRSLLTDFKTRTSAYRISSTASSGDAHSDAPSAETVLQAQLEQQAAVAQRKFDSRFQSGKQFPLGENGLVIEKVNLQPNGKGQGTHALGLHDVDGKGITLGVSVELFNSIFEVVERVVQQTNWELHLTVPDATGSRLLQ